jgi:hypothetical protein
MAAPESVEAKTHSTHVVRNRDGSKGGWGAPTPLQLMHQWKMERVREKKWWRKKEK